MRIPHERPRTREEYARGLPNYHDPTAGYGGAAPTYSALTLRLVLAALAIVLCLGAAVLCVVDFAWVLHRKRRGEPG